MDDTVPMVTKEAASPHDGGPEDQAPHEEPVHTGFRVWIDQDLCTGDGLCIDVVPEVFTQLEDGIAYVVEDGVVLNDPGMAESQAAVRPEHETAVIRAALICPGECIFIERDV